MGLKNVQVEEAQTSVEFLSEEEETETTSTAETEENFSKTNSSDIEHMRLLDQMIAFYSLLLNVLGIKVTLHWDWKKQPKFWSACFFLSYYFTSVVYTACMHCINGNPIRVLEPLTITGVGLSMAQKYRAFIKHWTVLIALIYNLRFICRRTAGLSSRANILIDEFRTTLKYVKAFALAMAFALGSFLILPVKVFIVEGELLSLIPMEIVFCDKSTKIGFAAANFMQAIMATYAVFCVANYAISFIIIICSYNLQVNLLEEDLKDLDEMWSGKMEVSLAYRRAFLINICKKRQDMNWYDFNIMCARLDS